MIGTILQPTYLPWLGYFEMIDAAEIFVIYDHVQFVKKSWHHRNRIKGPNGEILLTIPTKKAPRETALCKTELALLYEKSLSNHWASISHAYKRSTYFEDYSAALQTLYSTKYSSLTDLTVSFIRYFCDQLGVVTPFVNSSSVMFEMSHINSTERVVELCKKANITELYDANSAQSILDKSVFDANHISISFQQYEHPVYAQLYGSFLPYMSILDLLFNEGPRSFDVIKKGRRNSL